MKKKFLILMFACTFAFAGASYSTYASESTSTYSSDENSDEELFNNSVVEKPESTEEEVKEVKTAKTEITEVQKSIVKINNKFEIVKNVVGEKYENLDVLVEQIDSLNTYIDDNFDKIVANKETENQVVESLNSVENSLNKLLKTFNIELTEDDEFYEISGVIEEIDDNKIIIKTKDDTYEATIDDITVIKTDYKKGDDVTVKYSGTTTISDKIIIDKCLSIMVPEEIL